MKKEIRDIVIFYQRALKSQKGLISICELEGHQMEIIRDGKTVIRTVGPRVCPKSSPVFQEFKIWQVLNNIELSDANSLRRPLELEEKQLLYAELSIKEKLSKADALKLLFTNYKELDLNFKSIEGNRTQAQLYKAYRTIIEYSGHGEYDFSKMPAQHTYEIVKSVFTGMGCNSDFLKFDASKTDMVLDKQPLYRLWHLLYSYAGDNSKLGNESLINKISQLTGLPSEYAAVLANVSFSQDYGSLSAKAMMNILPHLRDGVEYSQACVYAGYNHSKRSLTKDELAVKEYKDTLDVLPRNSLRNPVVEKILNQMINVVNAIVEQYGKPDEIRIELARELKKSAAERAEDTAAISKTTQEHDKYKKVLQEEFGITNVSRNDLIRYKLYLELKAEFNLQMQLNSG